MKFKVGQIVEVVNNSGMRASLGATAVIEDITDEFLIVIWRTHFNFQMNGAYFPHHFKPALRKNQQLLFSFME